MTGKGLASDPWLISGSGVGAITLLQFGLVGGSSHQRPAPADSQLLSNTATGGTFTVTANYNVLFVPVSKTSGPIPYNASAAQVAAAINAVITLGPTVTVTGSGTPTDPWVITGLSQLVTTNDSGLAGGIIGSASQPLSAQLTSGGVLNATAGNAGIYLDLGSGAAIGQVEAGTAQTGFGEVVITATGDLQPDSSLPSGTVNVTGDNITLTSTTGAVGSQAAPLDISTHGTTALSGGTLGGVLNVSALNDIGLEQDSGDLIVGSISSLSGDVFVNVTHGSILDSRGATPASVLSQNQIQQVWNNLQLLNPAYTTSANPTVAAFENQVNFNYLQYWELLDNGTVQNGVYSLNPTPQSLQLFSPQTSAALEAEGQDGSNPTPAQIEAYAAGLYQSTVAFLNANVADFPSGPEFQTFDANYSYTATQAQVTSLTQDSVWTQPELEYAVDATGLAPVSGTPVGTTTPNVAGRNVTLDAGGSIGELAAPIDVSVNAMQAGPPTLTDGQIAALALATSPGDVLLDGTVGGQPISPVASGSQPPGFVLTGVHLIQTAPLFVSATNTFNATAGTSVYVQSTAENLNIGQVQAGGDASITAPGSIQSAGTHSTQIITSGNLSLLAGLGNLGTNATTPLVLNMGGILESATAGQDIDLEQNGGNLDFDRIVAGRAVQITSPYGGLFQEISNLPVVATSLVFDVNGAVDEPAGVNGSGSPAAPLEIQLSAPAELAGSASGSINIDSVGTPTEGALTLARLPSPSGNISGLSSTNGSVALQSALSILDGINAPSSSAPITDITGNNITLTTGGTSGSTIGNSATSPLYIDSAYSHPGTLTATSNESAYIVQTQGNLTLNQVDATSFGSAYLTALSGSILNGIPAPAKGPPTPNIVAEYVDLVAGGSVGPLNTEVSYIEGSAGTAASDSFTISNTGPAVVGGVTSDSGPVHAGGTVTIAAHSPVTVTENVIAGNDVYLSGDHDPGEVSNLIIEPGVVVQSTGVFQNGVLQAGTGNVFILGGDSVYIDGSTGSLPAATVLAANMVTIQDDYTPGGPIPGNDGESETIAIDGVVNAPHVQIDGSNGGDTFDLDGVFDGNVTVLGGAGNDTINVNPDGIEDTLTVNAGGGGSNRLFVDDSGNMTTSHHDVVVTNDSISGFGPGVIDYSATGSFTDPSGNDGILLIGPGVGGSKFNVQSTLAGSTTEIQTFGANNTFNVGSNEPMTGGIVDNIQGALTVAGNGADTMNVDDTGSTTAKTGTLSATTLTGLNMGAAGITYSGLASLNINLGSLGNTFTIANTASGTTTTLNSGTGADTVNVMAITGPATVNTGGGSNRNVVNVGSEEPMTGGIVDNILGALTVAGNGADTMNVDDTGSTTAKTGTLSATTLTGMNMGPSGITYSGLATLNISLGSGGTTGNTFNIAVAADTNLPANTNINAGSGGHDIMNSSWAGDFNGSLHLSGFATSTITVGNNFNGSLFESNPGSIKSITIGGSLTASGVLDVFDAADPKVPPVPTGLLGDIGTMTVGGWIAGLVEVSGNITTLDVGPANTPTAFYENNVSGQVIAGGAITNASVSGNVSGLIQSAFTGNSLYIGGSLTPTGVVAVSTTYPHVNAALESLTNLTIGQNLAGTLTVAGTLGTAAIGGSLSYPGILTAGNLNSLTIANSMSGQLIVPGTLKSMTVNGTVTGPTSGGGTIDVNPTGTGGSILTGSLGNLTIGGTLSGRVVSTGNISGTVTIDGPLQNGVITTNGSINGAIVIDGTFSNGQILAAGNMNGNISVKGPMERGRIVAIGNMNGNVTINGLVQNGVIATNGSINGALVIGGPLSSGQILSAGNMNGKITINGSLESGRIAALGSIDGNLRINGSIDSQSALVSGGSIGSKARGTALFVGNIDGIVAAVGSINLSTLRTTNKALYYKANDSLDAAVIDDIFSQGVSPFSPTDLFDKTMPLDLANLSQIVTNLNSLAVVKNQKKLAL